MVRYVFDVVGQNGGDRVASVEAEIHEAASKLTSLHKEVPDSGARDFARELVVRLLNVGQKQKAVLKLSLKDVDWTLHTTDRILSTIKWADTVKKGWGCRPGVHDMGRSALTVLLVSLYEFVDLANEKALEQEENRLGLLGRWIGLRMLYFAKLKSGEKGTGEQIATARRILRTGFIEENHTNRVNVLLPMAHAPLCSDPALPGPFLTMLNMIKHFASGPGYTAARFQQGEGAAVEKHHIYPKKWCQAQAHPSFSDAEWKLQWNSIYNLAWLEKDLNAKIESHPLIYLPVVRCLYADAGQAALNELQPSKKNTAPLDSTINDQNPNVSRVLKGGGKSETPWTPDRFYNDWLLEGQVSCRVLDDWLRDNLLGEDLHSQRRSNRWPGLEDNVVDEMRNRRNRVKTLMKEVARQNNPPIDISFTVQGADERSCSSKQPTN